MGWRLDWQRGFVIIVTLILHPCMGWDAQEQRGDQPSHVFFLTHLGAWNIALRLTLILQVVGRVEHFISRISVSQHLPTG